MSRHLSSNQFRGRVFILAILSIMLKPKRSVMHIAHFLFSTKCRPDLAAPANGLHIITLVLSPTSSRSRKVYQVDLFLWALFATRKKSMSRCFETWKSAWFIQVRLVETLLPW